MSDDDDLHEFDLSAWDAPPPPANLADAVVARMTATDEAIAVAMSNRTSQRRRMAKRLLIAGGSVAAVAALAIGAWLIVRPTIVERAGRGEVVAQKATHVDLGATSANLDAGASLAWKRDGNHISVVQRGNATWLVGGDDQLSIDAAPASVQASSANLRVEIAMNMTDVKLIGASAGTAAAVALLTVVVYEGHVKAVSGGQTTVVVPGTTVEVKPGEAPREKLAVGANNVPSDPRAELAIPAGESPIVYDPDGTTIVQFVHPACAKPTVAVSGFTPSAQPFMLPAGHYTYTMTCPPLLDSPSGTIDILHDTGDISGLPVAKITQPANGEEWPDPIHVEGTMVTGAHVSLGGKVVLVDNGHGFSGDLPAGDARRVLALRFEYETKVMYFMRRAARQLLPRDGRAELNIAVGESAIVHDPLGAVVVELLSKCPSVEVNGHIITAAMPLTVRDHLSYASACDPDVKGTIDVIKDDGAVGGKPMVTIDTPVDNTAWSYPLHVSGHAVGGARVSLANKQVAFGAGGNFTIIVDDGKPEVIALRVDYEKQTHYFMRRAGKAEDHTVASHMTDFDFSGVDRTAIQRTITDARAKLNACNADGTKSAKLKLRITIAATGEVKRVDQERDTDAPATADEISLVKCATVVISKLKFPPPHAETVVSYPIVYSVLKQTPPPAKCDADTLREQGTNAEAMGAHEQALKKFEQANACKSDIHTVQLAFMAACNAKNVQKARRFWGQLTPQMRDRVAALCVRNGISREKLDLE